MSNEHRKTKRSFQALLTKDESDFVDAVKKLSGSKSDRALLLMLSKHYLNGVNNERKD